MEQQGVHQVAGEHHHGRANVELLVFYQFGREQADDDRYRNEQRHPVNAGDRVIVAGGGKHGRDDGREDRESVHEDIAAIT